MWNINFLVILWSFPAHFLSYKSVVFLLMKYVSLLYLYPLRSCFFFYKLISDIVLLGYILQTGSDRAPLQVISHNDLWMKDISDQGKQESSVKKNNSTALIQFFSFPHLQGICEGNCSFMHILQMGNTQKVQNHSTKQEWIRTKLWVSNLLASLLQCHFPKLLLSDRSLHGYFWWDFFFSWVSPIEFDNLVFPVSLRKRYVGTWDSLTRATGQIAVIERMSLLECQR